MKISEMLSLPPGHCIGYWRLLEPPAMLPIGNRLRPYALAQCACGLIKRIGIENIVKSPRPSCGCAKFGTPVRPGDRFGRLTVIERAPHKGTGLYFLCRCDCGTEKAIRRDCLLKGTTTSCKCYQREAISKTHRRHGGDGTRLYKTWIAMRHRCSNKNSAAYRNYGARGISVCDEWQRFEMFRDWALGSGYADNLTIDRINNDGNYEPSNCRWATPSIQANNHRGNRMIQAFGESKTLSQWSADARCLVTKQTVARRLNEGWNPDLALSLPAYESKRIPVERATSF